MLYRSDVSFEAITGLPSFSAVNSSPLAVLLVPLERLLRRLLLLSSSRTMAAIMARAARATPTPMPAFAPALRDEPLMPSRLALEVGEAGKPVEEPEEGIKEAVDEPEAELVPEVALVPVDEDEDEDAVLDGTKSAMVLVLSLSSSGAGASSVWLMEVEHAVLAPQQAHELLLVL